MHLAKAESRELWEEIEDRWEELERNTGSNLRRVRDRVKPVGAASAETAAQLGAAATLLLQEIADGYRRLRNAL